MRKIIYLFIFFISLFLLNESISAYEEYNIGDVIKYEGIDFYVIEDSAGDNDIVKLLKATPLTVEEVNTYGVGHINRYTYSSIGTAYDICGNGSIGGMAYYSSESCGFENGSYVISGCTIDYKTSDVKNVIDSWASSKLDMSNIKDTRLISYSELMNNLGYSKSSLFGTTLRANSDYTPDWVYDIKAGIMTMASVGDSKEKNI